MEDVHRHPGRYALGMRQCGLVVLLLIFACDGDGTSPSPADRPDAGSMDVDASEPPQGLTVRVEVVDGLNSDAVLGDPMDLVVTPEGSPAVVYGATSVQSIERVIRYAVRRGDDDWMVEDALVPGADAPSQGDLLALSASVWDGTVHVAFLGGDDDDNVLTPFPTDLILASRGASGSWSERVLVDTSGEATGPCPGSYCGFGNVVGSHAAVASDGAGDWAVLYRDTHASFAEDDLRRSDVELHRADGATLLVDGERGGGAWGSLSFLPDGRLAAAYMVETERPGEDLRGIWVAWQSSDGFERAKVSDAGTTHRLSLAADASGRLWLAFYDSGSQDLVVAQSTPVSDSEEPEYARWSEERVDAAGSVGLHPDLALGADGSPSVVYGFCGAVADRNCPGNPAGSAEVRLARRRGDSWQIDRVDNGEGRGGVGFYNRLVALEPGRWAVAYQDVRNLDVLVALVEEN